MAMIGKKPAPLGPLPQAGVSPDLMASASQPLSSGMQASPMSAMPNIKPAHQGINWLGVLGDGLLGAAGQHGVYGPMMAQKQAEQTAFERGEQQYRTHRQDNNDEWMQRQVWEQAHKIDPTLAAVNSYMTLSDPQKSAYKEMHPGLDPDVATTLPNGQFYAGPRSGLAAALTGGQQQQPAPLPPKHRLIPMGGPGSPAPATFR